MRQLLNSLIVVSVFVVAGCVGNSDGNLEADPEIPTAAAPALMGVTYQVLFETSQGDFIIEVHEDWAPRGAARFRELVEAGFYDDCRFFRVIEGFMAQVGMNGDPELQAQWQENTIPDDPVVESNTRGYVSFATSGVDSRTCQFFINFGDNSNLDSMGFAPFGQVIDMPAEVADDKLFGMECVDGLFNGYGEGAPRGRGPSQTMIVQQGNAYLNAEFPELDYIVTARVLDDEGDEDVADVEGREAVEAEDDEP